jgi:hypothetical protein
VGQKNTIDRGGIEVECSAILFDQFPAALKHAAVDENAPAQAFEHMAGARHASVGAMKGQPQDRSPRLRADFAIAG